MKKLISIVMLAMTFTFSGAVSAELKLAVVNVDYIFDQMPQTKKAFEDIEKEFKKRGDALGKEQESVEKAAQRLQKEGMTLSSSEKTKLMETVQKYQTKVQNLSRDYEQKMYETRMSLYQQIGESIDSVSQKMSYDLVFTNQAIGFASNKVNDITSDVLDLVSKK